MILLRSSAKDPSLIYNKYSSSVAYYRKALMDKSITIVNEMIEEYPEKPMVL